MTNAVVHNEDDRPERSYWAPNYRRPGNIDLTWSDAARSWAAT